MNDSLPCLDLLEATPAILRGLMSEMSEEEAAEAGGRPFLDRGGALPSFASPCRRCCTNGRCTIDTVDGGAGGGVQAHFAKLDQKSGCAAWRAITTWKNEPTKESLARYRERDVDEIEQRS
jgi:hypothetical protein